MEKQQAILIHPRRPPAPAPYPGLTNSIIHRVCFIPIFTSTLLLGPLYDSVNHLTLHSFTKFLSSTVKYFESHSTTRPELTFLSRLFHLQHIEVDGESVCAMAGVLIPGGTVLANEEAAELGTRFLRTCNYGRNSTRAKLTTARIYWSEDTIPSSTNWGNKTVGGERLEDLIFSYDTGAGWNPRVLG
ncbi:glycoside hydrolase family 47 protein [Zopfia rhizophila CBS 207.26]|uniref:Glycoside hydrolase family 47 protein n=1 Tax=Zopfia rhizophila CBS 207.26 TaxID=1314779 RepID=A0A6A6DMV1_9PEZI|nr:glycoside hydrolase family 47 protein [Zopfia rhizophila CBS 207.26]